ncbi:sulfotransferase family 2 domain-containing protein [Jiella pacifica]|uniref:Sulfotransferase family 2 domain-containing protein n=1 Tax=Jiella pacifica TaxID=2696469 RepID=A0A6N9TG72_9HYPH|nr:sulfotransferase family 2 domain-containing protein [Jiella pacifica]NDW07868.1 sulfotransferase family 2 domain-containing protein [Jiella pacifica]
MVDPLWREAVSVAEQLVESGRIAAIAVPAAIEGEVRGAVSYGEPADAILIHKGWISRVPLERLRQVAHWKPAFENDVFILMSAKRLRSPRFLRRRPIIPFLLRSRPLAPIRSHLEDVDGRRFAGRQTVFVHISKAAGTSLFEAARRRAVRPLYLDDRLALKAAAPHLAAHDLIGGHVGFDALHAEIGDARYFAVVRDPLERLVSVAGHARRPGERVESFNSVMRFLAKGTLRDFLDRPGGPAELRLQQVMLTGKAEPSAELTCARLERITVGTVDGLDRFLARHRSSLGIDPADLPRLNVTRDRSSLVPQAEIDEAVAAHGQMIEDARAFYDLVRWRERLLDDPAADG